MPNSQAPSVSDVDPAADGIVRYVAAGGVVVDGGGQVLLLRRPSRDEIRLPKGHVEPGEMPEETALRETAEESGYADLAIECDLGSQAVSFEYKGRRYLRQERYFLMTLTGRRRVARSRKDEKQFTPSWVRLEEAAELLTFEPEREWLRRGAAALDGRADPSDRAGGAAAK